MKIRIIGACGSGKTYIAKRLSEVLEIPYYEMDNMIWDRRVKTKRTIESRNEVFFDVMNQENWIIEGAQYRWSSESFNIADLIIILNPNPFVRDFRVIKRFAEMQLGIGKYNYKQSFIELIDMLIQNKEFDKNSYSNILECTDAYKFKRIEARYFNSILKHVDFLRSKNAEKNTWNSLK